MKRAIAAMRQFAAKRAIAVLCGILASALIAACTFAATIRWTMRHVEVWETPTEIRLCLCGHEWIHNAESEAVRP